MIKRWINWTALKIGMSVYSKTLKGEKESH